MFEVALEDDRIAKNPVQGISVPRWDRREPRFLTVDEVDRIGAAAPPRYRTLIYFLAYTGLRIGEPRSAVSHLDLTQSVVGRGVVAGGRSRGKYGRLLRPNAFLFTGDRDAQIRQKTFRARVFQPAARRAGIKSTPTVRDLAHGPEPHGQGSLLASRSPGGARAQPTHDDGPAPLFPSVAELGVRRLDDLLGGPRERPSAYEGPDQPQ